MNVLPQQSTFKFIDKPLQYALGLMKNNGKKNLAAGYLLGWVVFPMTIVATPFTIVSDFCLGSIKAIASYKNEKDFDKALDIFKISLSYSIQQLVFTSTVSLIALGIFKKFFNFSSLFILSLWPAYYISGQCAISMLPDNWVGEERILPKYHFMTSTSQSNDSFHDKSVKNDSFLDHSVKNKIKQLQEGSRIVDTLIKSLINHAKNGEISGITKESIGESEYFETLTFVIIYELIAICDDNNKKEIVNQLVKLSNCQEDFIEDVIKNKKKLNQEEIDQCKRLLVSKGHDAEDKEKLDRKGLDKAREFFKHIGTISTPCLTNNDFYVKLQ